MYRILSAMLALVCLIVTPVVFGQETAQQATAETPQQTTKETPQQTAKETTPQTTTETAQKTKEESEQTHEPDVIFVPTPHDVVEKMLELVNVTKDDLLYDLGCGDGRIVVMAAKKYGCRAVGFDVDPERIKESLENVAKNKVEDLVKIEQKDIFKLDLSKANVVTLYLLPKLNERLIPQLQKLKPGSRIVSHSFAMKPMKPDKVIRFDSKEDKWQHTIYLWTTPLKKKDEGQKEKEREEEQQEEEENE